MNSSRPKTVLFAHFETLISHSEVVGWMNNYLPLVQNESFSREYPSFPGDTLQRGCTPLAESTSNLYKPWQPQPRNSYNNSTIPHPWESRARDVHFIIFFPSSPPLVPLPRASPTSYTLRRVSSPPQPLSFPHLPPSWAPFAHEATHHHPRWEGDKSWRRRGRGDSEG